MVLTTLLNNGPKGVVIKGLKGFFIKGIKNMP